MIVHKRWKEKTDRNVEGIIAKYIAETTFDDLPEEVVNQAKYCILDSLGCALGGHTTELGEIVVDFVKQLGGRQESTIIGCGERTSCVHATFVNSSLTNALDFDDTYIGHPSATVIPPAISVGEKTNASCKDLITAIVLGYEVSTRIGVAIRASVERKFIHGVSWQTFGTVAATSKLLGLSEPCIIDALGIAGANAPVPSSMKLVYNSMGPNMAKCLYFGTASELGVKAALLAQKGLRGPSNILDGKTGFWRMCGSDRCDFQRMVDGLGRKYNILKVSFKPYPACRLTHSAIDVAIKIIRENGIDLRDIERITIRTYSPVCAWPFTNTEPKTMVEAQFSTAYAVAAAINGINPGLDWFGLENLTNPDILNYARKIKLIGDKEADEAFRRESANIVAIGEIYASGKSYTGRVGFPKGDPRNPFTRREITEKFRSLALRTLSCRKINAIIKLVRVLEKIGKVRNLSGLLY